MGMSYKVRAAFVSLLLLLSTFLELSPSRAETPSPEAVTIAKEMVVSLKMADQFKTMMPIFLQAMKPAIVQGRPDVDRDFDTLTPMMLEAFQARVDQMLDSVAIIYASHFTVDDLRALTAFYKTPTGQKFLKETPIVMQETMAAGQKFGQSAATEMRQRMIDELRKKGRDL